MKMFVCKYCLGMFRIETDCSRHEKGCYENPKTKTCATCGYFRIPENRRKTFDCYGSGKREHWQKMCEFWKRKNT